jgi:PAS domain S-box-containing protein
MHLNTPAPHCGTDSPELERENLALRAKLRELEEEATLAELSSRKLLLALASTHSGYWEWHIDTGELEINARWAAIIGYELEELVPMKIEFWKKLCYHEDLERAERLIEEHLAGKSGFCELELRVRHKDGRWIWVQDRGQVFKRDSEGNPLSLIGTRQDIMAGKTAEMVIQSERELATRLSTATSFAESLKSILGKALAVSGMEIGGIYLIDHERQILTLACHQGLSSEFLLHAQQYPLDSPHSKLILEGKPIYSRYNELGLPGEEKLIAEKLQAIAILPVCYNGEVIASLNIGSRKLTEVPNFARKGLETFASHISAAIMHSRHQQNTEEAKSNLESLFDSIDDFAFIADNNGTVIKTNAAFRKNLGYSPEEQHRFNVFDFHPEEYRQEAKETLEKMLTGKESFIRLPLKSASGRLVPVETRITRGVWNKKPVLFGISRDISERILSAKALIENEKRFRELTELLPLPLFEVDTELRITYANHRCSEIFGYTAEELGAGFSALNFSIPEESGKVRTYYQAMADGSYVSRGNEFTGIRKDGTLFPAIFYGMPIMMDDRMTGARGLLVDLTEPKNAEKALRNSALQERIALEFKTLIDNIPGAVYRINSQGRTTMLSMRPDHLPDFSSKEYEQELFETLSMIHPDDRQSVAASTLELKSARRSVTLNYRIVTKQGDFRWIEDRKTSTFSNEGQFTGIDGILFDITERVTAQEERLLLEAQLRRSQRLETIGTLAGGIAHDFNNILTPILGYAEMGVISLPNDDPLQEYFTEIMQAAERAQNLVSQILTFSRAQEHTPVAVSVQAIISEALKLLRPSIPSTITIEQHIDKSCGAILADPSQIHQVIVNFCTNAFQAMERSGGLLKIDLREILMDEGMQKAFPKLKQGNYVRMSISDTGSGMDEATMERIFEPFFTTKSVNKGTGLGLSVVHGIVTSYNGEITVESIPGKGTTFRVYLPVIDDQAARDATPPPLAKGSGHILFVDDEAAAVQMMTHMLTKLGFSVNAECSPIEALKLFNQNPDHFDVVITDLTMPVMTGLQLAAELHKTRPELPVILMTGYGKNIEQIIPISRYGVCKMLKKPVRLAQLALTLNEVISSNHT